MAWKERPMGWGLPIVFDIVPSWGGGKRISYVGDTKRCTGSSRARVVCLWCQQKIKVAWGRAGEPVVLLERHACPMRGPSRLVTSRNHHPWSLLEWTLYMDTVRSTVLVNFVRCGVCGRSRGRAQVDPHPWYDPCERERIGKRSVGRMHWSVQSCRMVPRGTRSVGIDLTCREIEKRTLPRLLPPAGAGWGEDLCNHCARLKELPLYLPVEVCRRSHRAVGEWSPIRGWEKIGVATYVPTLSNPPPPRSGSLVDGDGDGDGGKGGGGGDGDGDWGVVVPTGLRRYYKDRYAFVVDGGTPEKRAAWVWIDPPGSTESATPAPPSFYRPPPWARGEKRQRVDVIREPSPMPPSHSKGWGQRGEVEGGLIVGDIDDDFFDMDAFNICYICQNVGRWEIFDEVPSAYVMGRYSKASIATNIPLCTACVRECESCGEYPAIVPLPGSSSHGAICNKCHWAR